MRFSSRYEITNLQFINMKATIPTLTLLLLLTACAGKNDKQQPVTFDDGEAAVETISNDKQDVATDNDEDATDSDLIGRDRYSFNVQKSYDDEGENASGDAIGYYLETLVDGELTDLTFEPAEFSSLLIDEVADLNELYNENDINFDGVPDLMLSCGLGGFSFHDAYFSAYVWDDKNLKFCEVEGFEQVCNPEFDPDTKTISSFYDDGGETVSHTYRWSDDGLKIVRVK